MPAPLSWSPSVVSALTGTDIIDALLGARHWSSGTVSYSFPDRDSTWSTDPDTGYGPRAGAGEPWQSGYRGLSPAQQAATEAALSAWSAVAGLHFERVTESATAAGDLRFAFVGPSVPDFIQAYAYLPDEAAFGGDVWFNRNGTNFTAAWNPGSYEYLTALHEIGHALGLKHPFEAEPGNDTVLRNALDSRSFTVMSYNAAPGRDGTVFSYEPTTPMRLDILAMQALYGANTQVGAGDTVYSFASAGLYHLTVLDADGIDTIVQLGRARAVIDLDGGWHGSRVAAPVYAQNPDGSGRERVPNLWIADGTVIENATGADGRDELYGNAVDNVLRGNAGRDTLAGGAGDDQLFGGGGKDTASFARAGAAVTVALSIAEAQATGEGADLMSSIENIEGSAFGDRLSGDTGDNRLWGAAGDDTLRGGGGADLLDGGAGVDTADYSSARRAVVVDLRLSTEQSTGGGGKDRLVSIEAVLGTALHDALSGDDGANTLDGGRGADTLAGNAGDDVYVVDDSGDVVIDTGYYGVDTVLVGATRFELAADAAIERIVYTGTAATALTGSAADSTLSGGLAGDTLDGAGGRDTVSYREAPAGVTADLAGHGASGGAGDDVLLHIEDLEGSAHADLLRGDAGDNRLAGGFGDDTLAGGAGDDRLLGGVGIDVASFDATLGDYAFGRSYSGDLTVADARGLDAPDGADTLFRVETLQFADRVLADLPPGASRVNETDAGDQLPGNVAALPDGGYAVVWSSAIPIPPGGVSGAMEVVLQRFDSAGRTVGGEVRLAGSAGDVKGTPDLVALPDGSVLIAWQSGWNSPMSGTVHLQRMGADGAQIGETREFGHALSDPQLTALADGGFLLCWSDGELHGQRLDAEGIASGAELQLTGAESPLEWSVAALADGGWVTLVREFRQEGELHAPGLYARRFAADGSQQGSDIHVNSAPNGGQQLASVTGLAGGGFMVYWTEGSLYPELLFRRFDADGGALDAAARGVAGAGAPTRTSEAVLGLDDGGFALVWRDTALGLVTQRFDAQGNARGDAHALDAQAWQSGGARLAELGDGRMVTLWGGWDASGRGVYVQQIDADGVPEAFVLPGTDAADTLRISGFGALAAAGGAGDDTYYVNEIADRVIEAPGEGSDTVMSSVSWTLADEVEALVLVDSPLRIDGTGNEAANRITGNADANVLEGRGGADTLLGGAGADTASYASAPAGVQVDLSVRNEQSTGGGGRDTLREIENLQGSAHDDQLRGDAAANRLDGGVGDDTLRGGDGADTLQGGLGTDLATYAQTHLRFGLLEDGRVSVQDLAATDSPLDLLEGIEGVAIGSARIGFGAGGEFRINASTAGDQYQQRVVGLRDGGFVAVWNSSTGDGSGDAIVAQRFDAQGRAVGAEVLVNQTVAGDQEYPAIAALADGGFAVAWQSASSVEREVFTRSFDADGTARGDEIRASADGGYPWLLPAITALADGGYVVAWTDWAPDVADQGTYARAFSAAGVARTGAFVLSGSIGTVEKLEAVVGLADGGFAAVWTRNESTGNATDLFLGIFDEDGSVVAAERALAQNAVGSQRNATAVQLAGGDIVVAWESPSAAGYGNSVFARRFDTDGTALGGQFRLPSGSANAEAMPTLAALENGGFAAAWLAETNAGQRELLRIFDASGKAVGDERRIDTPTTYPYPGEPELAALADGGFVATWGGNVADPYDILALRFDEFLQPVRPGLVGSAGADLLDVAGPGSMQVRAGDGDDTLVGGDGDVLAGGAGSDAFRFMLAPLGVLTLADLEPGVDRIELSAGVFSTLAPGPLDADAFVAGAGLVAAATAAQRVVYDTAGGNLYYDPDGAGGEAAVLLARLGAGVHPALAAADILIID